MTTHLMVVPSSHPSMQKQWQDRDTVHKAVMSLFPTRLPGHARERRATSNILYRVEPTRVVVQSSVPTIIPDSDTTVRRTVLDGLMENLIRPGMAVRFMIDVNPVVNVTDFGSGPRRVPLPGDEIPEWFAERLGAGFTDVAVHGMETQIVRTHSRKGKLLIASLSGSAVVADAAAASTLITDGIGRGKAYGCGLLTVTPL